MTIADRAGEKNIPVLIATGYAFTLDEPGHDLGRYDLLLKPVRPSELVEAVARRLASARH
jgi:CheY-like chemotaxis protein